MYRLPHQLSGERQSVAGAYIGPDVPAGQHHHHHPSYSSGHSHGDGSSGADLGGRVYSTLYSFVFGRDPDVPTVTQINRISNQASTNAPR